MQAATSSPSEIDSTQRHPAVTMLLDWYAWVTAHLPFLPLPAMPVIAQFLDTLTAPAAPAASAASAASASPADSAVATQATEATEATETGTIVPTVLAPVHDDGVPTEPNELNEPGVSEETGPGQEQEQGQGQGQIVEHIEIIEDDSPLGGLLNEWYEANRQHEGNSLAPTLDIGVARDQATFAWNEPILLSLRDIQTLDQHHVPVEELQAWAQRQQQDRVYELSGYDVDMRHARIGVSGSAGDPGLGVLLEIRGGSVRPLEVLSKEDDGREEPEALIWIARSIIDAGLPIEFRGAYPVMGDWVV
ncbi:hypothetical protein [Mitsuaria sp. GD03876]|uniref:hypothetical protein n=1 Tax=Mitsuaria sp. GD03876 TaxID=2975399 RepID=UPI002449AF75|nr:hypothetical protein [Mitsuaria sp. GD03876]MDH0866199.1 hypothetical protein [Mitsuaria sp. GD03876]